MIKKYVISNSDKISDMIRFIDNMLINYYIF